MVTKEKANDARQTIDIAYFCFSVYLWTDLRLGIFIIEIGLLLYILICVRIFLKRNPINKIVITVFICY